MIIIVAFITGIICYQLGKGTRTQRRKYETWDIDNEGELLVRELLNKAFDKKFNYLINNITLPTYDNGTTQIDHILINKYGIFVIETKHYSGYIFGEEDNYQWTQRFANGQKFQFFNPLKQNEGHIKHLTRQIKDLPSDRFFSIIVFTGKAKIKSDVGKKVLYANQLSNYIQSFHTQKLTLQQMHGFLIKKFLTSV